jgi:hypothetical protein
MIQKWFSPFIGVLMGAALLLAGCMNPLDQSEQDKPSGNGNVQLSLAGARARTLLPNQGPALSYTIEAVKGNDTEIIADAANPWDGSGTKDFSLEPGDWTITVTGYVTESGTQEAISQGSGSVTISADGTSTPETLEIQLSRLETVEGTGTLVYGGLEVGTINLSALTSADLILESATDSNAASITKSLKIDYAADSKIENLDAGYYILTVRLQQGNKIAAKSEVVHIYKDRTTKVADSEVLRFTVEDFLKILASFTAAASPATGTTTALTLTFDQVIAGLSANAISITAGTGSATKGALSGAGPVYTLAVSNVTSGTITVAVNLADYEIASRTVTVIFEFETVIKVDFAGQPTKTIDISNLQNQTVYLVKINTSASVASAADTGSVDGLWEPWSDSMSPSPSYNGAEEDFPQWFKDIQAFNANPPPIPSTPPRRTRALTSYSVGDTKTFWVLDDVTSTSSQQQATLRAQGTYGNVWVLDVDYTTANFTTDKKITAAQAQALAAKFDQIYPIETGLIGYEYGGGVPTIDQAYGGKDSDPRIQILVYDMAPGSSTSVAGFFWSGDFYSTSAISESNEAEIFYIDSDDVDRSPTSIYSTLVHEFQHMINFNVKYVQNGSLSQAWYNEMLSMMAEDVISPLIGIPPTDSGHPIAERISRFLQGYNLEGISEWGDNLTSYAKGFGFGAYLARNYGGAELLQKIMQTTTTGIDSLDEALGQTAGINFLTALKCYGEAFIYSDTSTPTGRTGVSFNQTMTKTIDGTAFTNTGFDIWAERYNLSGQYEGYYMEWGGPKIFELTPLEMRPHSVLVQSSNDWKNKSGTLDITLNKPNSNNVVLYLMVK